MLLVGAGLLLGKREFKENRVLHGGILSSKESNVQAPIIVIVSSPGFLV